MGRVEKVNGTKIWFAAGVLCAIISLSIIAWNECRASDPTPYYKDTSEVSTRQYSDTISVSSTYADYYLDFDGSDDKLVYFTMEDDSWWSAIVSEDVCKTIFAEDVDIMFAVDWDGDHTFMGFIY